MIFRRYTQVPITYEFSIHGQRFIKSVGNIYSYNMQSIMDLAKQHARLVKR